MPPKKIDPKKLLQKAQKAAQKEKTPIKPVIAQEFKKPLNPAQIKKEEQYEKEITAFFTQIKNIPLSTITQNGVIQLQEDPTDVVLPLFDMFAESHPTNWWPTKLINRILNSLDPTLYLDFATKYTAQNQKNVKEFFNSYVTQPTIAEQLRRYYEQRDMEAEEIDRLQKIVDEEFGEEIEEVITELPEFGPPKKPPGYKTKYRHTKFIDKYLLIDPQTGQPIGDLKPPPRSKRSYKKHKQNIRPHG